jgi:hypothetical protein
MERFTLALVGSRGQLQSYCRNGSNVEIVGRHFSDTVEAGNTIDDFVLTPD